jgi:hypothetical protein
MLSNVRINPTTSIIALAVFGGIFFGTALGAAYTSYSYRRSEDENENDDDDKENTTPKTRNPQSMEFQDIIMKTLSGSTTGGQHCDDGTHVNFVSDVICRLWPYINKAGSEMIISTVQPMFADMMPGPLKSLKFTKVDLGTVPMIIDNVIVHELGNPAATTTSATPGSGCLQFDWDVIWHSSSDIQLAADFGIAFGVKSILLKGRMSFLMKPLSNEIPCFDAITYSFINPPELELDFTGLANLADFSVATKMIRTILQDVLASMIVLPVRMVYKMNPLADFADIYTPFKGVARVRIHSGRGFQVEKRTLGADDIPDVYCVVQLGCEVPYKTSTIKNHLNPTWAEKDASHDFLLMDNDQIINVDVHDEDSGAMDSDDYLGRVHVTVASLLLAPNRTLELELSHKKSKGNWKPTGAFLTLSVDILPLSGLDHSSLKGSTAAQTTDNVTGLVTVLVNQAYNLPVSKGDAQSFVKVSYGNKSDSAFKELGVTGVVTDQPGYDALNPVYESPFHLPLLGVASNNMKYPDIKLQLMNKTDVVLGEIMIPYEELLKAKNGTFKGTKRPIGKGGALLSFVVSLSGVIKGSDQSLSTTTSQAVATTTTITTTTTGTTSGATSSATSSVLNGSTKVGSVRVVLVKAFGFQVKRKRGPFKKDDVPDVYCIVRFGSDPQSWRTATIKDSTTPTWNTSKDYAYTSPNQAINVDVYDENKRGKDDSIGTARTTVGKVLLNGGGCLDVEIMLDGKRTGTFVTLGCSMI